MVYIKKLDDHSIIVNGHGYYAGWKARTLGDEVIVERDDEVIVRDHYSNFRVTLRDESETIFSSAIELMKTLNEFIGNYHRICPALAAGLPGFIPEHFYFKHTAIFVNGIIFFAKENFTSGEDFDPVDWFNMGALDPSLKADKDFATDTDNYVVGKSYFELPIFEGKGGPLGFYQEYVSVDKEGDTEEKKLVSISAGRNMNWEGTGTNVKLNIDAEIAAREQGDSDTLQDAKDYADDTFVPKSATHSNGSTEIVNSDANNGLSVVTVQEDGNTLIGIVTNTKANNPVMGGITGEFGDTPVSGSKRLLFARGSDGEIYVHLRKNKAAPQIASELSDSDLLLNKGEIDALINNIMTSFSQGLKTPDIVDSESDLPDADSAENGAYYVVRDLDETAPGQQGRAWKNNAISEDEWQIVVDNVHALDNDWLILNTSGAITLGDDVKSLINSALQSSQLDNDWLVLNTNGAITLEDDVKSLINNSLQSSQLQSSEPSAVSTDLQVPTAKRLWLMMGAALSSLQTSAKTIVGAINELFGKFNATQGHDHDGVDSKKIASNNVNTVHLGGVDFDSVTTPGLYSITGNINAPAGTAGSLWMLRVWQANGTHVCQETCYYHGGIVYVRWLDETSWSDWKKINDGGNANTIVNSYDNSNMTIWAGDNASLPSSRSDDVLYFVL